MKRSSGFSLVEGVLLVIFIALVGVVGYNALAHLGSSQTPNTPSIDQTQPVTVPAAPEIKTSSDLDNASTTLDQINLDKNSDDLSGLDGELASF